MIISFENFFHHWPFTPLNNNGWRPLLPKIRDKRNINYIVKRSCTASYKNFSVPFIEYSILINYSMSNKPIIDRNFGMFHFSIYFNLASGITYFPKYLNLFWRCAMYGGFVTLRTKSAGIVRRYSQIPQAVVRRTMNNEYSHYDPEVLPVVVLNHPLSTLDCSDPGKFTQYSLLSRTSSSS